MITLLAALSLVLGCQTTPQCVDNGGCGDSEACIKQKCEPVDCLASDACQLHEFCDTRDDAYTCKSGCSQTTDCAAGEECNPTSHSCTAYGCRDTQLDCAIGESCDKSTGKCAKADGAYCKDCSGGGKNVCGNNGTCYAVDATNSYCFVDCNPKSGEDACPRGFECQDILGDGTYACTADCVLLADNGWLP